MAKLKSIVGCEITTNEIRAAEVAKIDSKYSVVAMGSIPLEEGIVEEGFIRDADQFNKAITELFAKANFQNKDVAIAVNNENVLMRYASFPKVDDDKLRNMVLLQAQEFIPIPIQEMEVDYVIAGESVDEEEIPQVNVMLVAARKQMLEGYINIFTASKLQVVDIDSSLLAYCRAINEIHSEEKYALVNLTDDVLNFIVVKGDEISMVRSITVPEKYYKAVDSVFKNIQDEDSEENYSQVLSFLTSETSSTISYYQMQSNEPLDKIFFIMNAGASERLINDLQENLYLTIERPGVYPEFQIDSITDMCEYASCISVAISKLEG